MRFNYLKRRDFITLIGGAATWPLAARAQQPAMPAIGFLSSGSSDGFAGGVAAFHQGLRQMGYHEGRNVTIQYRWADGQSERLPGLAAELVHGKAAVIVAWGGIAPAQAAKALTTSVPIVFLSGDDPIEAGLVASLARPGANVTGISWIASALEAKRLGLLLELVPKSADVAVLVNPNFPGAKTQLRDAQEAARERGVGIQVLNAGSERDIDMIFATLLQQQAGSLMVNPNPLFMNRRAQIVSLAARYAVPAIYYAREFVVAGGLMSYGTNLEEAFRQLGTYAGRVLKGDRPSDLPVMEPTKFEFVINMKGAVRNVVGICAARSPAT